MKNEIRNGICPKEHKKLVENMFSGGSGGVTSWNDLTDKPFYKTTTVKEILPETKVESVVDGEGGDAYTIYGLTEPLPTNLTAGARYIVTVNGVVYNTTAVDMGEGLVALVNDGGDFETQEGLAFYVVSIPAEAAENYAGLRLVVEMLDGSTPETLAIRGEVTEVKQIDDEFIPKEPVIVIKADNEEETYTSDEYTPAEIAKILNKNPLTKVVLKGFTDYSMTILGYMVANMVYLYPESDEVATVEFYNAFGRHVIDISPDGISRKNTNT